MMTRLETLIKHILSLFRKKLLKTGDKSQLGQGMLEYLLMLIMTVAIIAGLNRALGEPLQNYTRNYVGDMVRCIIDTGELPERAMQICGITITISLNEFRIETNPPGGTTTGNSNNTGDANGGADGDGGQGQDRNNNNNANDADRDGGGNNAGARNRASNRPRSGIRSRPQSASSSIDSGIPDLPGTERVASSELIGSGENSFEGSQAGENRVYIIRRRRAQGIGGQFSLYGDAKAAKKEEELRPAPLNVVRSVEQRDPSDIQEPQTPQAFKVEETKKRKLASKKETEQSLFSFGNILKWGIIIAILIIFGVFMFNQLNSIRKGWTS